MVSRSLLALLILPALVLPGAAMLVRQSKEVKTITGMDFDQMYQQTLKTVLQHPNAVSTLCAPLRSQRDYRYQTCLQEMAGTPAATMALIFDAFTKAGFKRVGSSIQGGDLDGSFVIANSPYSVEVTFNDSRINWNAYDEHRGHLAPRPGRDKDAPYALLDAADVAREVATQVAVGYAPITKQKLGWLHPCGPARETEAAICIQADWTRAEAQKALVGRYFADEMSWFVPLDKKPSFEYREEQRIADSIKRKILDPGDTSDLLIKKLNQTTYLMRHKRDWPAYEFVFTIPAAGQKGDFKVLARRIAAPPYKV